MFQAHSRDTDETKTIILSRIYLGPDRYIHAQDKDNIDYIVRQNPFGVLLCNDTHVAWTSEVRFKIECGFTHREEISPQGINVLEAEVVKGRKMPSKSVPALK
jgi:hypothetical protein